MASKPNTARQHKHFAILIKANSAQDTIVVNFLESYSLQAYLWRLEKLA
ncbi:Uncharacterised protein [Ectopseudomonas mendocina]|nr:Uncharacterised protein [Pseudomonas mendocina]